jgi:CheY-like chemotaxis protein
LEDEGYDVLEAPNGKEGIELFKEERADLIICDLIMPEKEGIETIMELRRDFPEVKIIAMSGGGRGGADQYLSSAKSLGANAALIKPFERETLLAVVSELLG